MAWVMLDWKRHIDYALRLLNFKFPDNDIGYVIDQRKSTKKEITFLVSFNTSDIF